MRDAPQRVRDIAVEIRDREITAGAEAMGRKRNQQERAERDADHGRPDLEATTTAMAARVALSPADCKRELDGTIDVDGEPMAFWLPASAREGAR